MTSESTMPYDETHVIPELSAYLDGELDAGRRARVEAHLGGCDACAAVAADLRALTGAAAAVGNRPPATDLWPRIRERIESGGHARVVPIDSARRRLSFTWTQLAAASVALVLLAGGSTWLVLSGRSADPSGGPAIVAERTPDSSGGAVLVADYADETYDAAVADLEGAVEASRDELDPQTVRTIEQNLRIIDQAITETRQALRADPNSAYLSSHLAEQRQRKLQVLRTAAQVATTSI